MGFEFFLASRGLRKNVTFSARVSKDVHLPHLAPYWLSEQYS